MDGETQAGDLWEVAVEYGYESRAAGEHRLQLFGGDHDTAQGIVVRQHADDVAIGDVALFNIVTDTTAILQTDVGFHGIAVGVGHEVAGIRLLASHNPLVVFIAHHEGVVAVTYLLGGNGLHLLVDVFCGITHRIILIINLLTLDEVGDESTVGGDEQLTDIGELHTRLCDGDLLTVEVLHLYALKDLVGVTVEHHIDTSGVVDKTVRTESHRLRGLTHM